MSKKVAVLFSGGLDSTYLIWKNLKEDKTTDIYFCTFNLFRCNFYKNYHLEIFLFGYGIAVRW